MSGQILRQVAAWEVFLWDRNPGSVQSMKVRWHDSSVRFRLSPAEVADWMATGWCVAAVRIGPSVQDLWSCRLELSLESDWHASADAGHLVVRVPHDAARHWFESGGIDLEHLTGWGTRLVIERDLPRRAARAR